MENLHGHVHQMSLKNIKEAEQAIKTQVLPHGSPDETKDDNF